MVFFIHIQELLVLVVGFIAFETFLDVLGEFLLAEVWIWLDENDSSDGGFGLKTTLTTAIHNLLLTIFIIRESI